MDLRNIPPITSVPVNNTPCRLVEVLGEVLLLLALGTLGGPWVDPLPHELGDVLLVGPVLVRHYELVVLGTEEDVGVGAAVVEVNVGGALVLLHEYLPARVSGFGRVEYWVVLGKGVCLD